MRAAVPRGSRASADGARPSARANIRRTTAPARLSQTVLHGASRNSSFQAGKPGLLREEDGIPPRKTRRRERTLGGTLLPSCKLRSPASHFAPNRRAILHSAKLRLQG